MLKNTKEMLEKAKNEKYAIPHFNINNLEWTKYILEVCQSNKSNVILGVSEGAAKYMGGYKTVYNMVSGLIEDLNITISVALHLDHGTSFESCKKAIDARFTSVMIDASRYSLEENITITKKVVEYAHTKNVTVEAEVGHIGGSEDGITSEIAYATLEDCIKLKEATNIDSLAPALGSVHGIYKGAPNLDFERMSQIKEATNLPLVLHGGTGIYDEQIKKSIECGITKININTELQIKWTENIREYIKQNPNQYDPRKIISSGEKGVKEAILEKIQLLGSSNKA